MRFPLLTKFTLVSTIAFNMGGCGPTDTASLPNALGEDFTCRGTIASCVELYGTATLNGPVSGADVLISTPDGKYVGTAKTNARGDFSLRINGPVKDYTVAVIGGTYAGQALIGTLRAEVRDQPQIGGHVSVNPITTLISQRMEANRRASLADSTAAILSFLDIPKAYGTGIDLTPRQFSGQLFSQAMATHGSVNKYASVLVAEADSGKKHPFHQHLLQGSATIEVAGFVAKGLASGVLGKVGGEAFSSIMGSLGLGFGGAQDSEAAKAAAAAAAEAARQQAAKLAEIANAVHALSVKLDTVQDTLLGAINKSTYSQALLGRVSDLITTNAFIDSELRALSSTPDKDRHARLKDYVLKNLVQGGLQNWHNVLYGPLTRDSSILVMWSKIVQQLKPEVYDASMAEAVQAQWDYFDAQQARSVAYIIDYMRSDPAYANDIASTLETWRANRKLQLSILRGNQRLQDTFFYPSGEAVLSEIVAVNALPRNTIVDRTTSTMWYLGEPIRTLGLTILPRDFDDGMTAMRYWAEYWSGVGGWDLPATRATVPHRPTDTSHFDGLQRLGLNIPEGCLIFYAETIYERAHLLYKNDPYPYTSTFTYWGAIFTNYNSSPAAPNFSDIDESKRFTPLAMNAGGDAFFFRYQTFWSTPPYERHDNILTTAYSYIKNDTAPPGNRRATGYEPFAGCWTATKQVTSDLWYR